MADQESFDAEQERDYSEEEYMPETVDEMAEYGDSAVGSPPGEPEPRPRSLLQSGLVRFMLVVLVVVALAGLITLGWLYSYRQSRSKPLKVDIYPGATLITSEKVYDGFDHAQYVSTDSFEQIEAFYARQDNMTCEPQYRVVELREGEEPLREGHIFTRCRVDRSGLGISQFTIVMIQPVYDENQNPTGRVVIDVQRYWGD